MSEERFGGLRARIAMEAARLMIEEDVKQYFTAKRMAAKRLLGRVEGGRTRHRPADLPSNGEIRDAVLALSSLREGASRMRRLFAMRVTALEAMGELEAFTPRLIGSVSTGHIRRGSDIDIHLFSPSEEPIAARLASLGWPYRREVASIRRGSDVCDYIHYQVELRFHLELTMYDPRDLRRVSRSSTDGKPIERVGPRALEALIARDHRAAWGDYRRTGALPPEHGEADDEAPPGPWDGLFDDESPPVAPEPGEEDDPTQSYDPLPGFEDF